MRVTKEQFNKALENEFDHPLEYTFKDWRSKCGAVVMRKIIDRETKKVFGFIFNWKKYFIIGW